MLTAEIIGYLGGNAYVQPKEGAIALRVAHDGMRNGVGFTTWVSVFYKCAKPENLCTFLIKGAKVYCRGYLSTRVYNDLNGCPQAGLSINATQLEIVQFSKDMIKENEKKDSDKGAGSAAPF